MASTYTPKQCLDLVKEFAHGIPTSLVDSQVVDIVNSLLWTSRPWRWTLTALTAIPLVDNTQDYTASNTNIYRLRRAWIRRTDTTPDTLSPLDIAEELYPEYQKRSHITIQKVALNYPTEQIRLEAPPSISGSMALQLEGDFQSTPTKVTDATMTTAFWFPDQYFPVMVEGVKWKLYQLADDARAGNVVVDRSGRRQYTGQLAVFMSSLAQMQEAEDFSGAAQMLPELSLGAKIGGTDVSAYGWR